MFRAFLAPTVLLAIGAVVGGGVLTGAAAPLAAPASVAACASVTSAARLTQAAKGLYDPTELTPAQVARFRAVLDKGLSKAGLTEEDVAPIDDTVIDVRWHVITRADGTGGVSSSRLAQQLQVLNDGYRGTTSSSAAKTKFTFRTASVDTTRNSDWYDWSLEDSDDQEAKSALHRGGYDDLNVYITGLSDGLLGYSTFPVERNLKLDGVVVLNESLPGGNVAPYNLGDTLTHEAGHWLGLLHTFENGCSVPGDIIADTPYQADGDNIFFCRESDDTCPASGRDPVHDFMSYGDDPCLDRFTPGQARRTALVWFVFRSGRVL